MAVNPPYEGAVFVEGDSELAVKLLEKADDPRQVVIYGGYGVWAPASAVAAVKEAKEKELDNGPLAPRVNSGIEIPELDGQVADENPLGGDVKEPLDPTADAVQPLVLEEEKPQENTAAADPDDAHDPNPIPEHAGEKPADDAVETKDDDEKDEADKPKTSRRSAAK